MIRPRPVRLGGSATAVRSVLGLGAERPAAEEGLVVGNLFCNPRMDRVNRMTFCEAASSSSWIVSSKFSLFRAFLAFFGLLWVRGKVGLKAG